MTLLITNAFPLVVHYDAEHEGNGALC